MNEFELGAKIRGYRKDKKLSIQALAEMVNITPSMLSQIERDLANPSINTLRQISNALEVPLFQFFTGTDNKEEAIVRKGERKKIFTKDSNSFYELLTPDTNGEIEFILQRFDSNTDSGGTLQSHIGEEVAFVMQGSLTLHLDQSEFVLNTGDSVRIPPMTPHLWQNHNPHEDAVLIFAITPPCF